MVHLGKPKSSSYSTTTKIPTTRCTREKPPGNLSSTREKTTMQNFLCPRTSVSTSLQKDDGIFSSPSKLIESR